MGGKALKGPRTGTWPGPRAGEGLGPASPPPRTAAPGPQGHFGPSGQAGRARKPEWPAGRPGAGRVLGSWAGARRLLCAQQAGPRGPGGVGPPDRVHRVRRDVRHPPQPHPPPACPGGGAQGCWEPPPAPRSGSAPQDGTGWGGGCRISRSPGSGGGREPWSAVRRAGAWRPSWALLWGTARPCTLGAGRAGAGRGGGGGLACTGVPIPGPAAPIFTWAGAGGLCRASPR